MKITIFSEELRECLNAACLSDCGENDTWNYWYQRLMNAYNESVERQITTEQAENAKLRELVRDALRPKYDQSLRMPPAKWREYDADVLRRAHELGVEL